MIRQSEGKKEAGGRKKEGNAGEWAEKKNYKK